MLKIVSLIMFLYDGVLCKVSVLEGAIHVFIFHVKKSLILSVSEGQWQKC